MPPANRKKLVALLFILLLTGVVLVLWWRRVHNLLLLIWRDILRVSTLSRTRLRWSIHLGLMWLALLVKLWRVLTTLVWREIHYLWRSASAPGNLHVLLLSGSRNMHLANRLWARLITTRAGLILSVMCAHYERYVRQTCC